MFPPRFGRRVRARPRGYFNIDRKYDSNSVRVTYIRYEINYALQLVRRGTTATRLSVSRGYIEWDSAQSRCDARERPATYGHFTTKDSRYKKRYSQASRESIVVRCHTVMRNNSARQRLPYILLTNVFLFKHLFLPLYILGLYCLEYYIIHLESIYMLFY